MFVVISSPSEAADSSLLFIAIAIYKPEDVRPILAAYHGKDIPLEYGKKEAEIKAQFVEEWKKEREGEVWRRSHVVRPFPWLQAGER